MPPRARLTLAGLLLLCVVPTAAGVARLVEIASNPAITADNSRFLLNPAPAVVHIVTGLVFNFVGAFLVVGAVRARSLRWHGLLGRVVGPAGILAGASGIWLSLAYWTLTRDGPVLFALRLLAGAAMVVCLLIAFVAAFRRRLAVHRAFMLRGYALGISAGVQFFTHLPWFVLSGELGKTTQAQTTVSMAAGWLISLAVAELQLRTRAQGPHVLLTNSR